MQTTGLDGIKLVQYLVCKNGLKCQPSKDLPFLRTKDSVISACFQEQKRKVSIQQGDVRETSSAIIRHTMAFQQRNTFLCVTSTKI